VHRIDGVHRDGVEVQQAQEGCVLGPVGFAHSLRADSDVLLMSRQKKRYAVPSTPIDSVFASLECSGDKIVLGSGSSGDKIVKSLDGIHDRAKKPGAEGVYQTRDRSVFRVVLSPCSVDLE
jgi:hypothetical protein